MFSTSLNAYAFVIYIYIYIYIYTYIYINNIYINNSYMCVMKSITDKQTLYTAFIYTRVTVCYVLPISYNTY